jgi:hypothetical protein
MPCKKRFPFLIILLLLFGCQGIQESKVTTDSDSIAHGYYGEKITSDKSISGKELSAFLAEKDSVWVTLKSKIVSNCQKTGCWMDLDLGNEELIKVTFKDYAFFIPTDSKGKTATVEGVAKKELIAVDLLKHYAEDEGKSQEEIDAITEPEWIYTFEASGVIIEE